MQNYANFWLVGWSAGINGNITNSTPPPNWVGAWAELGNLSRLVKGTNRTDRGTSFSSQILKYIQMEEFHRLFYSYWYMRCLLKLSNFTRTFFNLCSRSPCFIINLFELTSNFSRLNNLSIKCGI